MVYGGTVAANLSTYVFGGPFVEKKPDDSKSILVGELLWHCCFPKSASASSLCQWDYSRTINDQGCPKKNTPY